MRAPVRTASIAGSNRMLFRQTPLAGQRPTAAAAAAAARSANASSTDLQATAAPASAAAAPEMRKNPALYTAAIGTTGSYSGTPAAAATGPASATQPQPPAVPLSSKPEVLAPVGGWPQLRAAVESGADAVYFGLSDFSARARAANFTPDELPVVMSYLRARGVKGYVALNVLVFDEELQRLEERARQIAAAGVDAVIVQDVGAVALLRRVAPNLPIHGSTQMSITTAEGAEFAAALGVSRVVVGRELSVREIQKVAAGTSAEVEAFCHGALCVSYSGQCFSSESWGGRSANRGQCAQACRMPYGLLVDGALKELGDMSYLLSPQDLAAIDLIPDMIRAGVGCFKIEGRLKGPEYVALTTQAYRLAVDRAWEEITGERASSSSSSTPQQQQQQQQQFKGRQQKAGAVAAGTDPERDQLMQDLRQMFARGQDEEYDGLTPGFLEGVRHQRLVRGRAPRHRGVCLGRVTRVTRRGGVVMTLLAPVKPGDGVVFDQGMPEGEEEGGSVYEIYNVPMGSDNTLSHAPAAPARGIGRSGGRAAGGRGGRGAATAGGARQQGRGGRSANQSAAEPRRLEGPAAAGAEVELLFGTGQVDVRLLRPGDLVWRTKDHALESRIRASYESVPAAAARKLPVAVAVSGALGAPLVVEVRDDAGRLARAESAVPLQSAANRPMTAEDVTAAVSQMGDNTLRPTAVDTSGLRLEEGLFLPASAFKAVRRAAADAFLQQLEGHPYAESLAEAPVLPAILKEARSEPSTAQRNQSNQQKQQQQQEEAEGEGAQQGGQRQRGVKEPLIRVLCRTPGQVRAALEADWLEEVILDFLEVHGLREAVQEVQAAGRRAVVALPRILKPDEQRLLMFYLRLGADALLLRGAGALQQLLELGGEGAAVDTGPRGRKSPTKQQQQHEQQQEDEQGQEQKASSSGRRLVIPRLEGDFSLNAANALTAHLLLSSGLSRLAPTLDLDARQLAGIATSLGRARAADLEAIVHSHLPIFHTEHCVFARFLSEGDSFVDCGHPCERHGVRLRDHEGQEHLVLADMGCRNTVFNAEAQSGAYHLPRLAAAGYGTLRIELVDEPPETVKPLLDGYKAVIAGEAPPSRLWALLSRMPGGVGGGSLDVKSERAAAELRPTAATVKAGAAGKGNGSGIADLAAGLRGIDL